MGRGGVLQSWLGRIEDLTGLPRSVLAAMAVVVVGLVLALLVRGAVRRLMARIGRLLPGAGASGVAGARHRADVAVARGAYWLVLILSFMAATEILGLPVVTTWLGTVAGFLPRVLAALVIAVAGAVFGSLARGAVERALPSSNVVDPGRLGRVAQVVVVATALLVAFEQLGIAVGFITTLVLIAFAGLLVGGALAFGLGGKATVSNILAGHYVRKLYEVGHVIRIAETEGRILRVTPTAVVLETPRGEVAVPTSMFATTFSTRVAGRD